MFTWTKDCDQNIYKNGRMVAMTDADTETNSRIVETISNQIGRKLDWHYAAGRGIIRALSEDHEVAYNALKDKYPSGKLDSGRELLGEFYSFSIVLYAS